MGDPENLRSLESKVKSPVKFINRTAFDVEIFWLNFVGKEISFVILEKKGSAKKGLRVGSKIAVNTFVSHPWIAKDRASGKRLWLNSKEVFYPPEPRMARVAIGPDEEQLRVQRMNIFITTPGK